MKRKNICVLLIGIVLLGIGNILHAQNIQVPTMIEVGFIKTIHISFPSKIKYVDLGSNYIIAGKADETENVLRVKAAYKDFKEETNFSVITEDGGFYLFTAVYADYPEQQYYEMKSVLSLLAKERPTNHREVQLADINGESPIMLDLIMKSIYKTNKKDMKHIGERKGRIEATIRGIYVHNDMLYFHLSMKNKSNVSYDIDGLKFTIADRKKLKKQASQWLPILSVREFDNDQAGKVIVGNEYHRVIAFNKFTITPDKKLVLNINEKRGGRHIEFSIMPSDIVSALPINNIRL